jgi:hypothetical protein
MKSARSTAELISEGHQLAQARRLNKEDARLIREIASHMDVMRIAWRQEITAYEATVQNKDRQIEALAADNSRLKGALEFANPWLPPRNTRLAIDQVLLSRVEAALQTTATDAVIADMRDTARNELYAAFVKHARLAGLSDSDTVSVFEATDALLHCLEQLRSGNETAPDCLHSHAITDVIAERQRQIAAEGWTPEHDDSYQNSELADAAACYAIHAHNQGFSTPAHWPWDPSWWKQSGPRRDLVRAAALILAEIERIDRTELRSGKGAA